MDIENDAGEYQLLMKDVDAEVFISLLMGISYTKPESALLSVDSGRFIRYVINLDSFPNVKSGLKSVILKVLSLISKKVESQLYYQQDGEKKSQIYTIEITFHENLEQTFKDIIIAFNGKNISKNYDCSVEGILNDVISEVM